MSSLLLATSCHARDGSIYRLSDQRIETIVSDYANRSKVDYLRGLAHNIEMNT